MDRRCVASQRGRARLFLRYSNIPPPSLDRTPSRSSITSGPPHPLRVRGPEPVPDPSSTRRAWGPLTARSGAGRCRSCPAASASPAQLRRHGHPIHPAAVPANHRAPMAPHLAMGRGRAQRALSSSPRRRSCRPGSFPGSDQPLPLGDPAGTWVGVRRRRAALLGRRGLGF